MDSNNMNHPHFQNTLSVPWLLFSLFWGLFLIFAPVEADWRNGSLADMSHSTILILEQMRHYIAKPFLGAGIVFMLHSVIQQPFHLPYFLQQPLYIAGNLLAALCFILGIRFTLEIKFGIGSLPIYTWLSFHPEIFTLWMTFSAVLICLAANSCSDKEDIL